MGIRVVFVDDEPDICELVVDMFGEKDILIESFTDSEQAIKHIHEVMPDLVIVDFRMPETTGERLAARLPAGIPVACASGDLNLESKYPFVKILKKPFEMEYIREFIGSYLAAKKGNS
ncbi:MAG: response regulator [Pseudomonadota bacterium]